MTTGFDWQTEDEGAVEIPTAAPRTPLRFLLLFFFGLILILLLVAPRLWRQLPNQVAHTEADLLAIHALILDAAAHQDQTLFWDQLDPIADTGGWRYAQAQLMEQGNWPGWTSLGLVWDGDADDPVVFIAPDNTQATIEQRHRFRWFNPATAKEEEIGLAITFSYRFSETGRWLFTANPHTEQQAWQTHNIPLAAFLYPQQNNDLSLRLSSGIADIITRFCAEPGILCEPLPLFTVIFDDHLSTLGIALAEHNSLEWEVLRLPAPILIGVPQDEAGVQALQILYAQRLVLFLLPHMRVDATQDAFVNLAQVETALMAVGLRPRNAPLSTPVITPAGPPPIPWPTENLWLLCFGSEPTLYTFTPSTGSWQAVLSRPNLGAVYPLGNELVLVERGNELVAVERFDEIGQESIQLSLWRNGYIQPIFRYSRPGRDFSGNQALSTTPLANQWLLSYNDYEDNEQYILVDTQQCDEEGCAQQRVIGQPLWSPDGTQTLLVESVPGQAAHIHLGNAAANAHTLIDTGTKPVWLDNQTIAYFALPPVEPSYSVPIDELVVVDSQTLVEKLRLTHSDVYHILPDPSGNFFYRFYAVDLLPDGQYLITLTQNYLDPVLDHLVYVSYDSRSDQFAMASAASIPPTTPDVTWLVEESIRPSPRSLFIGQPLTWWLTLQKRQTEDRIEVELPFTSYRNALTSEITTSADGLWIAIWHEAWLTLLLPQPHYQMTIPIPEPSLAEPICGRGFWFSSSTP